jgi:hypothetical protein
LNVAAWSGLFTPSHGSVASIVPNKSIHAIGHPELTVLEIADSNSSHAAVTPLWFLFASLCLIPVSAIAPKMIVRCDLEPPFRRSLLL